MIPLDEMPEDRSDLAAVPVSFPHLSEEETARHLQLIGKVVDYLVRDGNELSAEDLTFLRSAQVADKKFWIWRFQDDANRPAYVTASEDSRGRVTRGYDDADGLSPEQAMLADYHNCY